MKLTRPHVRTGISLSCLLLSSATFIGAPFDCSAQEKVSYFNEDGKPVKEKTAVVLQQRLKLNDTTWEFNNYLITGPLYVSMRTSDEKGTIPNGRYISYTRKGNLDSLGQYRNGRKEGRWLVFTASGRALKELTYADGKLISHRDSTQMNEDEKKMTDSMTKGKAFMESEFESEFPGGAPAWIQYLSGHERYPDRAVGLEIQGTAIVEFIVDKQGQVNPLDIFMAHSVEFSIDRESMRLIRESPSWKPAEQYGKKVNSYKKQPFVFKLTAK